MILKTLNLATLLVVVWLLSHQTAIQQDLVQQRKDGAYVESGLLALRQEIRSFEDRLDAEPPVAAAVAVIPDATQTAEINRLQAEIANHQSASQQLKKSQELKLTLPWLMQAEFSKQQDPAAAADQLLSTKEIIWRTSLEQKSVEQTLQSLMGPIDVLASEWQQGYVDNTVETIFTTLSAAISTLEREGTTQR